jgi:hypothetical protein
MGDLEAWYQWPEYAPRPEANLADDLRSGSQDSPTTAELAPPTFVTRQGRSVSDDYRCRRGHPLRLRSGLEVLCV